MTIEEVIKQKSQLISQIKEYSPLFSRFFELDIPLSDYSKSIYEFDKNEEYIYRQKQLKKNISNKFQELFTDEYKQLNIKFPEQMACNIVDHHQVLNHPLLISSNIIANTNKLLQLEKQPAIIDISSGDVPPNNYFSKNGFMFQNKRIPIFTNREKEYNSNLIPKRDFDFIVNLKKAKRLNEFNKEEIEFLSDELKTIQDMDFSQCQNYNDQISVIVKHQWPRLFEEKLRKNLPELLYITQEEITARCLVDLLEKDNIVTHTLLNESFRKNVLDSFNGIVVTWNEKESKGTHFFWRKYPGQSRSLRMYLKGNKLVPQDERFKHLSVELEKDTIIELLAEGEIYPSLFIIFLILNFYYGVKPLVGQGSITYLNLIRDNWLKILKNSEYKSELVNIESYEIDKLITGIIIFFSRDNERLNTLWAYDIFNRGGMKEEYLKKLFSMSFRDLISTGLVGIYDYVKQKYIPEKKWLKPTITSNDLAKLVFKWL
ncbi:hypothetical protein KKG41_04240 [Patescibacteria group bacterium]|nr:hypothetical protein [Patescibacteria group bacterium]MBU1890977.1 hypothetical protein [Patescibacteria group bacterium]